MQVDPATIYLQSEPPLPTIVHEDWVGPVTVAKVKGTKEGRGLITTKQVGPGELLLISNPLVSADIGKVFTRYVRTSGEDGEGRRLEEIAESEVLDQLKELVDKSGEACEVVRCMADGHKADLAIPEDLNLLIKRAEAMESVGGEKIEREYLKQVCRANMFGPDYKLFPNIEGEWQQTRKIGKYRRLTGLYVMPAMINHSCVANACRVFVGETMFVRATRDLQAGEEVVWPYVFPLEPVKDRQDKLQQVLGFKCSCARCVAESAMPPAYQELCDRSWDIRRRGEGGEDVRGELVSFVNELEEYLAMASPDAEVRRWCRASFLNILFNRLNSMRSSPAQELQDMQQALKIATDLYWSLWMVNAVSTEHLSLLHTCYELAVFRDGSNSRLSTFWVEQLKKAHLVRYGDMDMETVLKLMKHTKLVLRHLNGLQMAPYYFI